MKDIFQNRLSQLLLNGDNSLFPVLPTRQVFSGKRIASVRAEWEELAHDASIIKTSLNLTGSVSYVKQRQMQLQTICTIITACVGHQLVFSTKTATR